MASLTGKVALLTGGLGTLGRAQARKLASEGARVVVLDRLDSADGPARAAALGSGVTFFGCDLNDLAKAEGAVRDLAAEVGGFDILINNAALIINKPHEDFTLTEYEDQIRVNSSAAFALTRACSGAMKDRGYGTVSYTHLTLPTSDLV